MQEFKKKVFIISHVQYVEKVVSHGVPCFVLLTRVYIAVLIQKKKSRMCMSKLGFFLSTTKCLDGRDAM